MNKTMSTKSIFTFQIIAGALLLSLLVFGCSSSDNDKTPIPLEGLWAITDTLTITMPEEEEPAVEEPTEEDSAGGEETTEGEGGTPEGAASLKNGENEQIGETEESTRDLEDGTFLDLKGTTYSYFSRSEGVEQGLSSGSYLRKGSELTFISASEDTITAEILELSAALLKLKIRIGEDLQEWTLARVETNTLPQEDEEEDTEDGKLEGLWELTETIDLELPDEDGDPVEESTRDLEDGTFLDLKGTTYSYFSRSEGVEQGLSSGSYLRKGSELTFISASEDTITAEILLLSATGLKLEIAIGEKLQEWTLERIELNNIPEEEEEEDPEDGKSEYVDYEAEFHDPEAPEGSLLNPLAITEENLNQNLKGVLAYSDEFSHPHPRMAESYYFLKTDTAASYRLTITVLEVEDEIYDHELLPQTFMRYVQLWVATRPDSEHFKADNKHIEEGHEGEAFVYEGLKTPSGFLYLRLFSWQDDIP